MKNLLLSLGVASISMITSIEANAGKTPRLRGFTTQKISIKNLEAMKKEWNANVVRLMMKPHYTRLRRRLKNDQAGWQYIIDNLPAYLDKAKDLNMAVVLDLHGVPNNVKYPKDRKANKRAFWNDEKNLKIMIKCWQQIAEMCKNRKQTIWYDIFNEPLNWDNMPNSPKKWHSWAQQITDAIRKIDKQHVIVIEPGPGGLCWGFKNFKPVNGKNIIYSIHQYQPHQYTHQGIQALKGTDLAKSYMETQRTWPGKFGDSGGGMWNKERIEKELKPAIDFQKKYKVRIYVGEFGVARWAPNADKYLQDCINIFEKYNWDWTYHGFRESKVWSLEHEETYGKGKTKRADKMTKRGEVIRKGMDKNFVLSYSFNGLDAMVGWSPTSGLTVTTGDKYLLMEATNVDSKIWRTVRLPVGRYSCAINSASNIRVKITANSWQAAGNDIYLNETRRNSDFKTYSIDFEAGGGDTLIIIQVNGSSGTSCKIKSLKITSGKQDLEFGTR